jgi:hypothetical protein
MRGNSLNRSQRLVLVVGLAAALYAFGLWLTGLGSNLREGWVAYAPLSNQFDITGLHPWVRLVVWILLIAVWAFTSAWILRDQLST